jgi:hypothetical protein
MIVELHQDVARQEVGRLGRRGATNGVNDDAVIGAGELRLGGVGPFGVNTEPFPFHRLEEGHIDFG